MRTKCFSVRLKSLTDISPKAWKAEAFDGSTAIIPKSQVFGQDYSVQKCEAYWIAAWILEKKDLQYSDKKEAWFNENGDMMPTYTITKHTPERMKPLENNTIKRLKK